MGIVRSCYPFCFIKLHEAWYCREVLMKALYSSRSAHLHLWRLHWKHKKWKSMNKQQCFHLLKQHSLRGNMVQDTGKQWFLFPALLSARRSLTLSKSFYSGTSFICLGCVRLISTLTNELHIIICKAQHFCRFWKTKICKALWNSRWCRYVKISLLLPLLRTQTWAHHPGDKDKFCFENFGSQAPAV